MAHLSTYGWLPHEKKKTLSVEIHACQPPVFLTRSSCFISMVGKSKSRFNNFSQIRWIWRFLQSWILIWAFWTCTFYFWVGGSNWLHRGLTINHLGGVVKIAKKWFRRSLGEKNETEGSKKIDLAMIFTTPPPSQMINGRPLTPLEMTGKITVSQIDMELISVKWQTIQETCEILMKWTYQKWLINRT